MTKKEAIELLVNNSIQAVVVVNQYDMNGRSFCQVEGFTSNEKAEKAFDFYKEHQQDYDYPTMLTLNQAVRRRNHIGDNESTNIKDDWTKEPIGLDKMLINK